MSNVRSPVPRVLFVEDDTEIRELMLEEFRAEGFEVVAAATGDAGLALLSANPSIELLFSDLHMRGMSGDELGLAAQRLRPGLKVLLTTGYIDQPTTAFQVVQKPYRTADIAALFHSLLAARPAPA